MGDLSDAQFHLVNNVEAAGEFMRWLSTVDCVSIDTETDGFDSINGTLRMVQIGDGVHGWAIPWAQWGGVALEAIQKFEGRFRMFNAKFDVAWLQEHGKFRFPWERLDDVMVMAHVIDPRGPKDGGIGHALKPLAAKWIDAKAVASQQRLDDAMVEQKWTWGTVPVDFQWYWVYAAMDAVLTHRLGDLFQPSVQSRHRRIYELEMASTRVLMEMQRRGLRIDRAGALETQSKLAEYCEQLRTWCKETYGFSPGSARKIAEQLQADGIVLTETTPGGDWATGKDVLEGLDHPLAVQVLNYRRAQKVVGTYADTILEKADADDIVHFDIRPLGTRTGRMSMELLQTLPRDSEKNPFAILVRDMFIPREGRKLVMADYDQVEMRLLAHFSGDARMLEQIRRGDELAAQGKSGYDLHSMNARGIYGIPDDQPVTKPQRNLTKNGGFAKVYGAGVVRFADTVGVDVETARAFLEKYDSTYPGVPAFQSAVAQMAMERQFKEGEAYVTSPHGRRHPTDSNGVYKLVNYLIQGTAADVLKEKIVELDLAGLGEYMLLPVHDEVIFDVPEEQLEEVVPLIRKTMSEEDAFNVPLTVGVDIEDRWGSKYRK